MTTTNKFEFVLEEDQGFILHHEHPRCKCKLGDDDDIFDEIEWIDPVDNEIKEKIIQDLTNWYLYDFQGLSKEELEQTAD